VVRIEGCSTVIFNCRNDEHPTFTGIYYILKLKANIISVGELDEVGYDVHIASGTMQNKDADGCLLAKIPHPHNQLYVLNNDIAQMVCLLAQGVEEAWRWHARLSHLNFQVLKKMSNQDWACSLPQINQVNQLCDGCLVSKHWRTSFSEQAEYHAKWALDIVHGDLCSPISRTTSGGKKMFLLLVDDFSRFVQSVLMQSKYEAPVAMK
jgi:hypothetical protein